MKAQITKVEITPKEPCYLCGHAIRLDLSQGVMDPLYVSALIMEDNEKKNVFLSYDLILIDEELSMKIKSEVAKEIECAEDNVVVSFIHTHAAPETGEKSVFNDPEKGARVGYRDFLVESARKAVSLANQNLEDVEIFYASTLIDGFYSNRNDKNRPCDKSANLFKLLRKDQSILAVMVNMTCHPTVLGPQNYLISADLFGAIRSALSDIYHCDVLMMQGAAGDMGNRQYRQGNDQKELFRMRDGIVPQLIDSDISYNKIETNRIEWHKYDYHKQYKIDLDELKMRLKKNEEELSVETDENQIKLLSSGITMLKQVIQEGSDITLSLKGNIIRIDKIIIVCVPCELFNQLGVKIKDNFPDYHVIIWGYCDYSVGYLVEADEYGKSYESIATNIKKGIPEDYTEYLIEEIQKIL